MPGGLEFASQEEQPLEVRVVVGLDRAGTSCNGLLRLRSNLYTSCGLKCASEAEQPFKFQVILGPARYLLGCQDRLLSLCEDNLCRCGGYNPLVTQGIG